MFKTYRVYYNRVLDWPQCWSVDEGDWRSEINVCGFAIDQCAVVSRELPPDQRARVDRDREPVAWLEVAGVLAIERGHALFSLS